MPLEAVEQEFHRTGPALSPTENDVQIRFGFADADFVVHPVKMVPGSLSADDVPELNGFFSIHRIQPGTAHTRQDACRELLVLDHSTHHTMKAGAIPQTVCVSYSIPRFFSTRKIF
jgi:hypothetical protein